MRLQHVLIRTNYRRAENEAGREDSSSSVNEHYQGLLDLNKQDVATRDFIENLNARLNLLKIFDF
jgi:hypothetical protein